MLNLKSIVVTGGPGSGKSTVLEALRGEGCICIDEPARQIIEEQRAINGSGMSDRDPALFIELMLSRSISRYKDVYQTPEAVIFDRGVPDMIAYAALFDLKFDHGWVAAKEFRYNPTVFFAPTWEEIYRTDEERTMPFEASAAMGDNLRTIYEQLGYTVLNLPLTSLAERAEFIFQNSPCDLKT